MKVSFFYVSESYINYLKKVELASRGYTTVPKHCFKPLDFKSSQFSQVEKSLLEKEYRTCKKLYSKAQKQAKKTYNRVIPGDNEELLRNSCDFLLLETACIKYEQDNK